jgi:hypothetical protein
MTRVTFGKSRVRESRMFGSVRAKPNSTVNKESETTVRRFQFI